MVFDFLDKPEDVAKGDSVDFLVSIHAERPFDQWLRVVVSTAGDTSTLISYHRIKAIRK